MVIHPRVTASIYLSDHPYVKFSIHDFLFRVKNIYSQIKSSDSTEIDKQSKACEIDLNKIYQWIGSIDLTKIYKWSKYGESARLIDSQGVALSLIKIYKRINDKE